MFKLPTRKPDFYFKLTPEVEIPVWQEGEYYVLNLRGKKDDITYSERAIWQELPEGRKNEARFTFFNAAVKYFAKIK